MVRAKTPKITYYSDLSKCQLMEAIENYEMFFYDGVKITKSSSNELKLTALNGDIESKSFSSFALSRSNDAFIPNDLYWRHFKDCYEHCLTVERTLSNIQGTEQCFPLIMGRRPTTTVASNPLVSNNKENTGYLTPSTNVILPSFGIPSIVSNISSAHPTKQNFIPHKPPKKVSVPGIGIASQVGFVY